MLATKSGDSALLDEIDAAAARFSDLQRAEIAARGAADRERIARRDAERAAAEAGLRAEVATKSLDEERKRNLFLTSLGSLDRDVVEILHHQIIIHAAAINEIVNTQFDKLRDGVMPTRDDLVSAFENIAVQNRKVLSTARFATKANFRLDSETIDEDLVGYVVEYINKVAPVFSETGIRMLVTSEAKGLHRRFKPIEVSILIDNLVSNAGRADASEISFHLDQPSPHELRIVVVDDGNGLLPLLPSLAACSRRASRHLRVRAWASTTSPKFWTTWGGDYSRARGKRRPVCYPDQGLRGMQLDYKICGSMTSQTTSTPRAESPIFPGR